MTDHFFIVGAQRCGTTYLYRLLEQHPEIEMARPVRPEPKFFLDDARYAEGLAAYEHTCFSGKPGAWLRGEKSTSYLESDKAAARIATAFPKARIVVLVRDPVARAVSHWRFSVQNGVETLPLEEALAREPERREQYDRTRFSVSPYAYLRRGRYVDDLGTWSRRFPPDRIAVRVTEALVGAPAAVRDLFEWIGVDPGFRPAGVERRVNASALDGDGDSADDTLSAALRERLAAYFAEPNARLAERYGLDLSSWQRPHRAGAA